MGSATILIVMMIVPLLVAHISVNGVQSWMSCINVVTTKSLDSTTAP
jgi:hypothetical protein